MITINANVLSLKYVNDDGFIFERRYFVASSSYIYTNVCVHLTEGNMSSVTDRYVGIGDEYTMTVVSI
jgi:hypothetical protein